MAESFFATLRAELVDHETYATAGAAERSIGHYIESFYNVERLHSHLDYVSPIEFELKTHVAAIARIVNLSTGAGEHQSGVDVAPAVSLCKLVRQLAAVSGGRIGTKGLRCFATL